MMSRKKSQKLVKGKRVYLRYPELKDAKEFVALSKSSKKFHKGLVSPPDSLEGFQDYLKKNHTDSNECFLICNAEHEIVGVINLSQIFHGGFKNAYLGYYLFKKYISQGYMTEALKLALRFTFLDLKLHRLEANIQPHNLASIKLVKRCGFTKEGFSRKYLKINGKWCDHERWAIIKEDWVNQNK